MPGVEDLNVLDPYYGTTADFDHVWRLVDAAAEVLAGKLG
jgi:protein-tyrosine-phosphatase